MWKLIFINLLIIITFISAQNTNGTTTKSPSNQDTDSDFIYIPSNQSSLQCDMHLYNQTTTNDHPISYYQIAIDDSFELPPLITVCHSNIDPTTSNYTEDLEFPIFLSIIKQIGTKETIMTYPITETDDTNICHGYGLQIDLSTLIDTKQYGIYYIAVENWYGEFSLEMTCGLQQEANIHDKTVLIIIICVVSIGLIVFCTFYYLQLKRLRKPDQHETLPHEDSIGGSIENKTYDFDVEANIIPNNGSFIDLRDDDTSNEENEEDQDPIVSVFESLIDQIENKEGLDIYQALAFRCHDPKSRRMKLKKPFSKFRINLDLIYLSSFQRVLYVAIVTFSLQVIGITIILYSVVFADKNWAYWEGQCFYSGEDWKNHSNWLYKILAFLWAMVITLSIAIHQKRMRDSGLSKIIDQIPNDLYSILDCVDIVVLHLGLLCNLYTLLVAVLGSYFIIFTSAGGADAMDMVLNAVALFFMIELDDMLVTSSDYKCVEKGCKAFLANYVREKKQNLPCIEDKDREFRPRRHSVPGKQLCGIEGMSRMTKCVEWFGYVIAGVTVVLGLVAPVVILICYNGFQEEDLMI